MPKRVTPLPTEAFDTDEPPNTLTRLMDAMLARVEAYVIEAEAYAALCGEIVHAVRGRRAKPKLTPLQEGEAGSPVDLPMLPASIRIDQAEAKGRTRVTDRALIVEALGPGPMDRDALFEKVSSLGYDKHPQRLWDYLTHMSSPQDGSIVRVSPGVYALASEGNPIADGGALEPTKARGDDPAEG